jgi:exopolysaccharide biosynthesis predicted pyruvyltransferase EpsI
MDNFNIESFLSEYKNKKIILVCNSGNAGDALIAKGTFDLFEKIGIEYEFGSWTTKYNNSELFYSGGGNLSGMYPHCRKFIKNNFRNNNIVVLPHTVRGVWKILRKFTKRVKIICREEVSYNHVYNTIKNKNNAMISDDMAFHCNIPTKYKNIIGEGHVNCFRKAGECESPKNINLPNDNIDLSLTCGGGDMDSHSFVNEIFENVMQELSKYKTISTNRLHMAIGGALLGKQVNFYSNNYYKCKAVYEYSLKKYSNVKWCGDCDYEN